MDPVSAFAHNPLSSYQADSSQQRDYYRAIDDTHAQYDIARDAYSHSPTVGGSLGIPSSMEHSMLPKVGQTRCYWTLLNASLQFIFPDPVLKYHLQDQAAGFLKCSLLDFVHPDEQDSAQRDLGSVLEERTLHGSVTRVRYCRLSRVRRILGWSDSSLPYPPSFPAERIAVDADYMAVYLVVNCVAEDLVLCFIHAVVDIAPRADNDEFHKTGWTNWCSTYGFEEEQARALYQCLCENTITVQRSLELGHNNSLRILQILRNQPNRQLVITWPPESAFLQAHQIIPKADTLARLAQHVQIGSMGTGGNDDARTSCTRRYKSIETIEVPTPEGSKTFQIESIFIPHGTVIFACHKIDIVYFHTEHAYLPLEYRESAHSPQMTETGYREFGSVNQTYTIPELLTPQHDLPAQNYVQQWVEGQSHPMRLHRDEYLWGHVTLHAGSQGLVSASVNSAQSGDDSPNDENLFHDSWRKNPHATEKSLPAAIGTSNTPTLTTPQNETFDSVYEMGPSTSLLATPFVTQTSHSGKRGSRSPSHEDEKTATASKDRLSRERYNGSGKGSGNPPAGVSECAHCNASQSPEWRKGPSGKKDLCNACGLRFARSRAKKEGVISRKRKEKEKESMSNEQACLQSGLDSPTTAAETKGRYKYKEGLIVLSQKINPYSSGSHPLLSNEPTPSQMLSTPTNINASSYLFPRTVGSDSDITVLGSRDGHETMPHRKNRAERRNDDRFLKNPVSNKPPTPGMIMTGDYPW